MIAGPPCETWTIARWSFLEHGHSPPVLRTALYPWGRPRLGHKHYQQVYTSNKLLQITLTFFTHLILSGGFAIVEHPAEPTWKPQAASIFRLAVTSWLKKAPGVQIVKVSQGIHGQISEKPTELLALRTPTLKQHVLRRQGHYEPREPIHSLTGRNDDGTFRTAAAKEYPPTPEFLHGSCQNSSRRHPTQFRQQMEQ